jgi:beta-galactosidase
MIQSILRWGFVLCLSAISFGVALPLHAKDRPRQRLTADFGWKFIKGDMPDANKPGFDDIAWRTVNLPHDWSIEGPCTQSGSVGGGGVMCEF